MKTAYVIAGIIFLAGLYMEYQKDSSFSSVDTGSLLLGAGVGVAAGCLL